MPNNVLTPHFAYPFRFQQAADGTISAAVVEQDTTDEVLACVRAIIACPVGFRDELPPFGIRSPLFRQAPLDAAALAAQIGQWEPRADLTAAEYADVASEAYRHIQLGVSTGPSVAPV